MIFWSLSFSYTLDEVRQSFLERCKLLCIWFTSVADICRFARVCNLSLVRLWARPLLSRGYARDRHVR